MKTPTEVAAAALQQATESLRRAEDRLNAYMNSNQSDFTSAGFLALSAEVTRCTAREERAQRNYDNALAAQSRANEQRITLHQYLQSIPPLPNYYRNLPGPTSNIPPKVRHPQMVLHWESFEQEVLDYIQTDVLPDIKIIETPKYQMIGTAISNEVPSLQIFCCLNLFEIATRQMGSTVLATERGKTVGNPDGYIVDDASQSIKVVY